MERLTYDFCIAGKHCWQVKGTDNLECGEVCKSRDDEGCNECPIANAFDRLAAIEDILGDDYDLDRLKEMVEADREGKCIVLPCKVGETVYTIEQEFNGFCTEVKIEKRIIDGCGGNLLNPVWVVSKKPYELHYFPSEFGKTVFTTHEEAESALEKMKEGK